MLRFALVIAATWLYIAVAGLLSLPVLLTRYRLGWLYAEARWGLRILLWLAGVKIEVEGRQWLPRGGHVVYMANHQSLLDPPILLLSLPGKISFLAKRGIFRMPLLGWVMRLGGFIPVSRENREQARLSVQRAAAQVRQGRPLLVFPEGTRSRDGALLPFRMGVFQIAAQAGAVIVPITLSGADACLGRGSLRLRPGRVRIVIHPPLEARLSEDLSPLAAAVQQTISSALIAAR